MICPFCKKEAKWCENKEIYGKNFGKSYMCYYCKDCDAYVGCHQNSERPLGTMANAELREWRKKAHSVLDPVWQSRSHGNKSRKHIYRILGEYFDREIHIAESDIEQCQEIIKTVNLLF